MTLATTAPLAHGVRMTKPEKPKCPDCGRSSLYYSHRKGVYTCQKCPFVGKLKPARKAK